MYKAFPSVQALSDASLDVRAGEIHALMGENGAGKSTLIKVLTGVHARDAGEVFFDGNALNAESPLDAERRGISTVYQEVNLIPHLSVAENIALGRQKTRMGFIRWRDLTQRAEQALKRFDVNIDVTRELCSYSVAIQQMVAIARAVDVDAKLLVLDEPTASLDESEVAELFRILRRLKDQGLGMIFITHFLNQVYELTDRITILRNGETVGSEDTATLPRLELISYMLGKPVDQLRESSSSGSALPLNEKPAWLEVSGLGSKGVMPPFDLEVRQGEAIGLAGLLGSGRSETARILFGILKTDEGTLKIDGEGVSGFRNPSQAIARALAFCSEDRKREGIIPHLSVRENIILALQARKGLGKQVSRKEQEKLADRYIERLRIKTPNREAPIRTLSGGNQQKVLLARWLATEPQLIILDEPTRGIDIGAREEIEGLIRELQQDGVSVLLISSELDEIERLCNRVYVLRDRQFIGELSGSEISESAIMNQIAHANDER